MSDLEAPRPKMPPRRDGPPYPMPPSTPPEPRIEYTPPGSAEPPPSPPSFEKEPENLSRRPRTPGPPDDPPGRRMVCPYCLSEFDWDSAPLISRDTADGEVALVRAPGENEVRWRNRTMHAWRVCEMTDEDHFIPAAIGGMTTLIVGMVGQAGSGKSSLLWAMMEELGQSALKISHRLDVLPLDPRLQQELFDRNQLGLLNERKLLPATRLPVTPEFACAYRITSGHTGEQYALLIFDVPGEIFTRGGIAASTPFMSIADALMFVADGASLDTRHGRRTSDPGFTAVLSHLAHVHPGRGREFLPIPAAMVVAKSDTLRVFKEVDEWLGRKDDLDLHTVEQESEDAYAFLKARGVESWLVPVQKFADSTLHFASATGVEAQDGEYPEKSFRRQRVLRPLLSLLAMKGVLPRESLGTVPEDA
ncbi:hypothetical protein [Actinomadura pelletieri]|nr:hypothetical protein [Actinomadura pelletieri]